MGAPRALLIAGPTASGKTGLAVALARRTGGEVINADSMQVYRDLSVLSARPGPDERAGVPHRLFGHVDGAEDYSVGRWLAEARPAIAAARERGAAPIVVGGTGLYFRALTEGLAETPDPGEDARREARRILETEGLEALAERAAALDPDAARRAGRGDPQRLARIVEVALGTGKPLSRYQAETRPALPREAWRAAVLAPEREALNRRIAERARAMMTAGAADEARALLARGLPGDRPVMRALGVATLRRRLAGEIDDDGAVEALTVETRQYAKRQRTWFRNQAPDWPRVDPLSDDAADRLYAALAPA